MALTQTDKDTVARIARKEVKDFMSKPQFKNEIETIISQHVKSNKKTRGEIVDIVSKVTLELYKTFWLTNGNRTKL